MLQICQLWKGFKAPIETIGTQPSAYSITLEPNDARRLASLCGQFDENLRLIEQRLNC